MKDTCILSFLLVVAPVGTWRQFLVAQEDALHRLSSRVGQDLSLEAAATLAVNPPTAAFLLRSHVHTHPPPAILQNGANSAVGRLIIQMAAQQQRRSINLIRPRPDFDALKAELERLGGGWARVLSTAAPLDELTAAVDECQPRVAFNCVGGEAASGLLCRLMPEDSEIVTYGGMSGRPLVVSAGALIFKNLRFSGFWLSRIKQRDESLMERVLKECEGMLRDGQISTAPMEHVSLEQVTNDHLKFGNGIKKLIIF